MLYFWLTFPTQKTISFACLLTSAWSRGWNVRLVVPEFDSLVESDQKTLLKVGIHSFPAWRSALKGWCEDKPAVRLFYPWAKHLIGLPLPLFRFRHSFICPGTSTRWHWRDLFGLRVKLAPVTTSLTTQR